MFRKIYYYIRYRIHNERIKPDWAKDPNIITLKAPKGTYAWDSHWKHFSDTYDPKEAARKAALKAKRAEKRAARKNSKGE